MLAAATVRMLAPLLALEAAGPLRSKAQLHMLTHALQREFGGRLPAGIGGPEGMYDFSGGRLGPHSSQLDRDICDSPSIVEHTVSPPHRAAGRVYHSYAITGRGMRSLGAMKAGAGAGLVGSMEVRIRRLCEDMPVALLEGAYGGQDGAEDSAMAASAKSGVADALSAIRSVREGPKIWRAISFGSILEAVEEALEAAGGQCSGTQRSVIVRLSCDIVGACGGIDDMAVPGDPALPDVHLADAEDLTDNLCRYCEKHGLMRDPMARPLDEDKANLICTDLRKAEG